MADRYGYGEEYGEEEIWGVVKDNKDGSPAKGIRSKDFSPPSSSSSSNSNFSSRRLPSASRMIPRANGHMEESGSRGLRRSAPVNIPDWSEIYRNNQSYSGNDHRANDGVCDVDDEDDDDDDKVPPHEWLAKKLARSQISSFSVCEGAGRTLKGRDQRKVRNAVLTRTGFLE